jgi:hypothetical protein
MLVSVSSSVKNHLYDAQAYVLVLAILCLYVLPMCYHFWLFLFIVDGIYCRARDSSGDCPAEEVRQ